VPDDSLFEVLDDFDNSDLYSYMTIRNWY
jgi:hypothetical protein